jgi:cytochrome c oxidase subunit IV
MRWLRPISATAYVITWAALVLLALASLALSYANLGSFSVPAALAIAVVKAALVALFFMHLVEGPFGYRFVLLIAVLFVVILAGFVALDVATRGVMPLVPPPVRRA